MIGGVLAASLVVSAGCVTTDDASLCSALNNVFADSRAFGAGDTASCMLSALSPFSAVRYQQSDLIWNRSEDDDAGFAVRDGSWFLRNVTSSADTRLGSFDAGFDTPIATDPSLTWSGLSTSARFEIPDSESGFQSIDSTLPGSVTPEGWKSDEGSDSGRSLLHLDTAWTEAKDFVYSSIVTNFLALNRR